MSTVAADIDALTGVSAAVDSSNIMTITAASGYKFDFLPAVLSSPSTTTFTGTSDPTVTVSGIYTGTSNDTFTFTAPSNPCNLVLVLIQDGTGSRTIVWPATVKWPDGTAPTLSTAGASVDIVSFYYDGTNYHGVASLAFSVPVG